MKETNSLYSEPSPVQLTQIEWRRAGWMTLLYLQINQNYNLVNSGHLYWAYIIWYLNANGPRVPYTSGALLLIDSSAHVEGSCTSHQKLRPAERLCGDCVSWTINPIRVARIPVFPLATLSLAGTHKSGSLHQVDPPSLPHWAEGKRRHNQARALLYLMIYVEGNWGKPLFSF